MFKMGDLVIFNGELFTVIDVNKFGDCTIHRKYKTRSNIRQCDLKPRYEVKYIVLDHLSECKSQLFDTEQQAFDYINKPHVNVSERWKYSDGTIVTVNELIGNTVRFSFDKFRDEFVTSHPLETFLENFTKCE